MSSFPRFDDDTGRAPAELYTEPRWYACYTRARHEKKVASVLATQGIDSYVPVATRTSQWKDRKKRVAFPLFPGYVFGRFTLQDVHRVLTTPGVSTIVRTNGYPTPISDDDIGNVRAFTEALERSDVEPVRRPYFAEGTRVRVTDGPFKDVSGIVVETRGRGRILIGLEVIGQGLEIDIDAGVLAAVETS